LMAFSWGFFSSQAPVKMHLHRRCGKSFLAKIPDHRIPGSLGLSPSHIYISQ
jgi:hypothetical protein